MTIWQVERLGRRGDGVAVSDDGQKALAAMTLPGEVIEGEVVDGVILWWREEDGDLTDALVDATQDVAEGGFVWLLTPKVGHEGHVSGADIGEAAPIAGLSITTTSAVGPNWVATKLSTHKR